MKAPAHVHENTMVARLPPVAWSEFRRLLSAA